MTKPNWKILATLSISKFLEAVVRLSILGYVPQTVHKFGTPWREVGHAQGAVFSVYYISNSFAGLMYGWGYDTLNKRKFYVLVCAILATATILCGLSTNVEFLISSRLLVGLAAGVNIGIKVFIGQICPSSESMAYVLTYTQAAPYTAAMILGPLIGGLLALPVEQYPHVFHGNTFLDKMPVFLPNVLIGLCLFATGGVAMITLPQQKTTLLYQKERKRLLNVAEGSSSLHALFSQTAEHDDDSGHQNNKSYWSLLTNRNFMLACLINICYQSSTEGFFEVLSLWFATPVRFTGAGLSQSVCGQIYLFPALFSLLFECTLLSKINQSLKARKSYVVWSFFKVFLMATITTMDIPGHQHISFVMFATSIAVINVASSGCKVSSILFINNSVDQSVLGFATAIVQFTGYIMAAVVLFIAGPLFSWSLKNERWSGEEHPLAFPLNHQLPFFIMALLTLSGAMASIFLSPKVDGVD